MTWPFPKRVRILEPANALHDRMSAWDLCSPYMRQTLPPGALDILWADELRWLCAKLRINAPASAPMRQMLRDLRWLANGKQLTRGICEALRRRDCIEADPPIEGEAA